MHEDGIYVKDKIVTKVLTKALKPLCKLLLVFGAFKM